MKHSFHVLLVTLTPALMMALASSPAFAAEEDALAGPASIATEHCATMLSGGVAGMGFVLGKGGARFSNAEMETFNISFAKKLIADYGIKASEPCRLTDVNSYTQARHGGTSVPHSQRDRTPIHDRDITVISGTLSGVNDVPVGIAYRLERSGANAWNIRNISLNGQPMADRYREEFEALAKEQNARAVLDRL